MWEASGSYAYTQIGGVPVCAFLRHNGQYEATHGFGDVKDVEESNILLYGKDKDTLARGVYVAWQLTRDTIKKRHTKAEVEKINQRNLETKFRRYRGTVGYPDGPYVEVHTESMARTTHVMGVVEKVLNQEYEEPAPPIELKLGATDCSDKPKKTRTYWVKVINQFVTRTIHVKDWRLAWEYHNEGVSGDYGDADDDVPLLRVYLHHKTQDDAIATYCTKTPIDTSLERLRELSVDLLRHLPDDPAAFSRAVMETWTHRTGEDST